MSLSSLWKTSPPKQNVVYSIEYSVIADINVITGSKAAKVHSKITIVKLTPTVLILTLAKCVYASTLVSVEITLSKVLKINTKFRVDLTPNFS